LCDPAGVAVLDDPGRDRQDSRRDPDAA
jgi:hypothetical protein